MFQFHPPGGLLSGCTKLNVVGVNLGKVATDLQVSIAGIGCNVDPDTYVPSKRFAMSLLVSLCYNFYQNIIGT